MFPILVHMFDDGGNLLMGIAQGKIDQTLDVAAKEIPRVVPVIFQTLRKAARQ